MSSRKLLNFILVAAGVIETIGLRCGHNFVGMNYQEPKVLDLLKAMPVNNLTNHTGHHISEQMTYGETSECEDILNNIYCRLPNDTQMITMLDKESLSSRVDSLGRLLQDPFVNFSNPPGRETSMNGHTEFETKSMCNSTLASMFEIDTMGHEKDITLITSSKPEPNLSRRDSFEDLMLHLRKIGSLPNILLNSKDGDDHT